MSKPQSPLAFRDYRLFWIARFCAVLAQVGMVVVIGWQVYDLTHDPFALGMVGFCQFLPALLLVLPVLPVPTIDVPPIPPTPAEPSTLTRIGS